MIEVAFVSTALLVTLGFLVSKYFIADEALLTIFSDQPRLREDGSDWGVYPETEP